MNFHFTSIHVASWLALALGSLCAQEQAPPTDETPAPPRGLIERAEGAGPGYTLYTPVMDRNTYLVDMDGKVVKQWISDAPAGQAVYLLDSGRLLRTALVRDGKFGGGGMAGRLVEYDWNGIVTWDYSLSRDGLKSHHDVEPLPNGNILVIAWETRTREEAIAAGRDPAHVRGAGMWPDCVLEIEPVRPTDGKVVWEWHVWDHLVQDFDPEQANFGDVTAHPERLDVNFDCRESTPLSPEERARLEEVEAQMRAIGYVGDDDDEEDDGPNRKRPLMRLEKPDWLHTNSIDYHPELDLIVLSSRHASEVWVIDHSTTTEQAQGSTGGRWGRGGDFLYRWGNPRLYGHDVPPAQRFFEQHDASWLGDTDDLRLLVFNNGGGRPGGDRSSVDEIALPFTVDQGFQRADGQAFGPTKPAWSYGFADREHVYFSFLSSAQRLPNGNTLVCGGTEGLLLEVTPDEQVVWEYVTPHGRRDQLLRGGPGDVVRPGQGAPPPRPLPRRGPPGAQRGRQMDGHLFRGTRIPPDHPGLADKVL